MSSVVLTNSAVSLLVSDPWEFGSECGTGPFLGTIVGVSPRSVTVRLATPITYRGKKYQAAVASLRHMGDRLESITCGPLAANLLLLTYEDRDMADVTDDAARDGVMVIGTLERR